MYKSLSNDYDRFVNWNNRLAYELPFIEKQIAGLQSAPGQALNILDAACGTGMHAIALAQRGHNLSAADLVPEMTERARENTGYAGTALEVKTAGFGDLERSFGAQRFDLLLCLGNSLPHVLTRADLSAALKDFAACLRPGGILLIQNRNFDAVMASMERWMEPQTHREGEEEWIFQRFYDFEPDELIRFNIVTLQRKGQGEWKSSVSSTHLCPQLERDLRQGLTAAGFGSILSFGSMVGEEFNPTASGNLILTAIKQ